MSLPDAMLRIVKNVIDVEMTHHLRAEGWIGLFTTRGKIELDIELEGKKLTQRDSFVYLGGAVGGDGKTERETCTSKNTGRSERAESS